jgi:hypothetical protein
MMAPTSSSFPPVKPWLQKSARLKWKSRKDSEKTFSFIVRAFGQNLEIDTPPPQEDDSNVDEPRGFLDSLAAFFFTQNRMPASGANPRYIIFLSLGNRILLSF